MSSVGGQTTSLTASNMKRIIPLKGLVGRVFGRAREQILSPDHKEGIIKRMGPSASGAFRWRVDGGHVFRVWAHSRWLENI